MVNRRSTRHRPQSQWLLELVTHGVLDVRTRRGQWTALGVNEGVLLPPGVYREERVRVGVCSSKWIFFDWEGDDLDAFRSADRLLWKVCDPDQLVLGALESLCNLPRINLADQLAAYGHLCRVASLLFSALGGATLQISEQGAATASLVDRANRFMRSRLEEDCRVADVARHVGLSVSGLHHAYRRISGRSPMVVLREMRVGAAKAMMLHGAMTLDQIADKTGFADGFHLSRTFKKQEGLSPRAFLRRATKSTGNSAIVEEE